MDYLLRPFELLEVWVGESVPSPKETRFGSDSGPIRSEPGPWRQFVPLGGQDDAGCGKSVITPPGPNTCFTDGRDARFADRLPRAIVMDTASAQPGDLVESSRQSGADPHVLGAMECRACNGCRGRWVAAGPPRDPFCRQSTKNGVGEVQRLID